MKVRAIRKRNQALMWAAIHYWPRVRAYRALRGEAVALFHLAALGYAPRPSFAQSVLRQNWRDSPLAEREQLWKTEQKP